MHTRPPLPPSRSLGLAASSSLGLALALALAACNGSPAASDSPARVAVTTSTTVRPQIAWPARPDSAALAALGPDATNVTRSPVPVLAPAASARLADPHVIVDAEYYAINGKLDGATVTIQGTRMQHVYQGMPKIDGDRAVRGTKGFVTVNEGIRSASWMENGASYTVDVECDSPSKDARCASDAFVLELAGALVYVGGAGAGGSR
jgi:hypothetical protein